MTLRQSHQVGAVAGLGPAIVILAYYLGTGGPVQPGILTFLISPVVAGWLIGAPLQGTKRATAIGAIGYLIAAYLVHSTFGILASSAREGRDLSSFVWALLEALGTGAFVTAIYFPFWALVLSPLALVWAVTARVLRGLLPADPGSTESGRRARRSRRQSSLLLASAAALLAYTLGFMAVAPAQCMTTQTVSGDASATNPDPTVCSSLIGITYSGQGSFDPLREPAIVFGLVVAAFAFAIALTTLLALGRPDRAAPSGSETE